MVARLIILGAFFIAIIALVLYAVVWAYQTHVGKEVTETTLDHERRLERERRDYDTVVEFAEDDVLESDHDRDRK